MKKVRIRSLRSGAEKTVPAKHADILIRLGKYEVAEDEIVQAPKGRKRRTAVAAPAEIVTSETDDGPAADATADTPHAEDATDAPGSDASDGDPGDESEVGAKPRRKYTRRDLTAEE